MTDRYDVVIIGGGPAGSTCATMLAREGHRVLVLERAKFPRFHIGESITAWGLTAFRKLGVFDELHEMNYVRKKGLDFVLPGRTVGLFFEKEEDWEGPGEQPWAIQMPRAKLDQVLLENAKRSGAQVLEQHAVRELLFEGERMVGVEYADVSEGAQGQPKRAYARFVIDASGQAGVVNRHLKDNSYPDPLLREKIAVFNHWQGDIHVTNTDEDRNFKLCVHKNQRDWAWYIPLAKDTVSLGVVLSRESVKNRDGSIEELFYEHAAEIPFIRNLVSDPGLKTIDKFRSAKDYSFRCKRYAGEGWVLVGDSAGFIDPIFSTGLQIAFGSSFLLSNTLNGILKNEIDEKAALGEYSAGLDRLYKANSMFVHLFYKAKLDFVNMQRPLVIWRMIEWAGLRHRLKFLWVGLRALRHSEEQRSSWTREVLFGKFAPGNLLADLLLNLQQNYEELHRRRDRAALRRTPPQPERAVPAVAASGA